MPTVNLRRHGPHGSGRQAKAPDTAGMRNLRCLLLLALAMLTAGCQTAVQRGQVAAAAGNHALALAHWQIGAEAGDPEAMFLVGLCHEEGRGTPRDQAAAAAAYHQGAERGYPAAMNHYGLCCFQGTGTTRDVEAAAAWFTAAASKGHAPALTNLGILHLLGLGAAQDVDRAAELLATAAAAGDPPARRLLTALEKQAAAGPVAALRQALADGPVAAAPAR